MGGTILLADDSITIQKVVELTFAETEHKVVAVSGGNELLRRVRDVQPDVVVCDVVMPDLNGYEVCQTLKSDPATLHIPVVLLTGTFEPFDRDRALAVGCDSIVTKPFEARELIDVVDDLIRRSQATGAVLPEPEVPLGFADMGIPEGVQALDFTTTGFDAMVPPPPVQPTVPEYGIELTESAIGRPLSPAHPEAPPAAEEPPAAVEEAVHGADAFGTPVGGEEGALPGEAPAPAEPAADEAAGLVAPQVTSWAAPSENFGASPDGFDEPVAEAPSEAVPGQIVAGEGFAFGAEAAEASPAGVAEQPPERLQPPEGVAEAPLAGAEPEPWRPEAPGFAVAEVVGHPAEPGEEELGDGGSPFAPEEEPLSPPARALPELSIQAVSAPEEAPPAEPSEAEGPIAEPAAAPIAEVMASEGVGFAEPFAAPPEEDPWPGETPVEGETTANLEVTEPADAEAAPPAAAEAALEAAPVEVPAEPFEAPADRGESVFGEALSPAPPEPVAGLPEQEPAAESVLSEPAAEALVPEPAAELPPLEPVADVAMPVVDSEAAASEAPGAVSALVEAPAVAPFAVAPVGEVEWPSPPPTVEEVPAVAAPEFPGEAFVGDAPAEPVPAVVEVAGGAFGEMAALAPEPVDAVESAGFLEASAPMAVLAEARVEAALVETHGAAEPSVEPGPEPAAAAVPAPALLGEELVEQIVARVTSRLSAQPAPPTRLELSEEETKKLAGRVLAMMPPAPSPALPAALSYELEDSEIERIARRTVEMMPVAAPQPVAISETEMERVVTAVVARTLPLPAPMVQSLEVGESEVERIVGMALARVPAPPATAPGHLPDEELDRVASRVLEMVPTLKPPAPAPTLEGHEPDSAEVDRIARRALELAGPMLEKIAWEVLPDLAEMLVRRRIAEIEATAESES